jgi:hypothetical protein
MTIAECPDDYNEAANDFIKLHGKELEPQVLKLARFYSIDLHELLSRTMVTVWEKWPSELSVLPAVGVLALRGQQRRPGPGVITTEVRPHILDEPPQRRPGVVDQWHHALTRPGTPGALAMTDVQLAESAQLSLDVAQIELTRLVDPQPDLAINRHAV